MTFTRIAACFPTREAAEEAQRWAERYAVKVPMRIQRHDCGNPAHQREPCLLVSVVTIRDEPLPVALAVGSNGHR